MSRFRKSILFGLLIATVGVIASFLDLVHDLEQNTALDLLFKLRDQGNAAIVIEHNVDVINLAD